MHLPMRLRMALIAIAVIAVSFFISLKAMDWLSPRAALPKAAQVDLPPLPPASRASFVMAPVSIALSALRDAAERGAPRNFDHCRVDDLDSRTKPVIEGAARPDRLADHAGNRTTLSRQSRLQLARNHDRRTVAGDELKINARPREANPSHHAFNHHKSAGPAAELVRVGRLYHGELRIAPYSRFLLARLLFDHQPLDGAATGLEVGPHPGIACREQRRRGRAGGPVPRIGDDEIGDRPAPAIGSAGQLDKVGSSTGQAVAQERMGAIRDLRRAAFSVGHVQPAKPHDSAIAEFNIETLIDADHLHVSGRPAASRKARGGENDGRQRHASAAEPASGVGERCAGAVRKAKIHAKGMARLASPCP